MYSLEYFGHGEFYMFDNGYAVDEAKFVSPSSRPLRLQLDEESFVATITYVSSPRGCGFFSPRCGGSMCSRRQRLVVHRSIVATPPRCCPPPLPRHSLHRRAVVARRPHVAATTLRWAYETGVHSNIYGDADLLPTGHVLACYWPSQLSSTMQQQFDSRLVEVIPGHPDASGDDDDSNHADSADKVAWELLVHGHYCTEVRSQPWIAP